MNDSPFSPKVMAVCIGGAIVLFAMSLILHAYQPPQPQSDRTAGPSSYSVSAIGHAGLYDFLERMKRPVIRSLSADIHPRTGRDGVLILAEPSMRHVDADAWTRVSQAPKVLVVLPKWGGVASRVKQDWIAKIRPGSELSAMQALAIASKEAVVFRTAWPKEWKENRLGVTPSGGDIAQLVRSPKLTPLVGEAEGMLLGELRDGRQTVWVLSDPDVMANHGLFKGDNAAFMLALVDYMRGSNSAKDAPLVFDETVHGFRQRGKSPLTLLVLFPYNIVTILCCLTAALLFLASGRMGRPVPVRPPLDFGKRGLIANSARLLDYSGHHAHVLRRYIRMTIRATATDLHAPAGLSENQCMAWLDRVGKARKVSRSCAAIWNRARAVTGQTDKDIDLLFACARDIHLWKGEIDNGFIPHRHHRNPNPR